ncbi:MAG: FAD/NAD(P)-binding protein [Pseudomonadota bacterium]
MRDGATDGRTHLIVGDGITALAFLEHGAFRPDDALIVLGAAASELGRGAAYAKGEAGVPWRYAYLLNSPADDIDPAFARWLSANWEHVRDAMTGRAPDWLGAAEPLVRDGDVYGLNAPREFYGDFMREQATGAIAGLRARGVDVSLVDDAAVAIDCDGPRTIVRTRAGAAIVADTVDIAPGGPATLRIDGDDGPFAAPSVFGNEHRIVEHIRAGREIFCIGGNAAMLDVLRLCLSVIPESELRFTACAPDGAIPEPLIPRLPRRVTRPELTTGHETAESFLAEIWREIELAKRAGEDQREIRAGFRDHFLARPLREYLEDEAEALRVAAELRLWLRGGTRDTILDMRRLTASGEARVLQGMVRAVEHGPDGATVRIQDAAGGEVPYETGFVVNCAGAGAASLFDPLTEDLLRQGLIEKCPISKGLRVGTGALTKAGGVRHLSPATTVIGEEVAAMPLYDAHMLRTYVARVAG